MGPAARILAPQVSNAAHAQFLAQVASIAEGAKLGWGESDAERGGHEVLHHDAVHERRAVQVASGVSKQLAEG
eukprot:261159-Rhodomonas_salina.1